MNENVDEMNDFMKITNNKIRWRKKNHNLRLSSMRVLPIDRCKLTSCFLYSVDGNSRRKIILTTFFSDSFLVHWYNEPNYWLNFVKDRTALHEESVEC